MASVDADASADPPESVAPGASRRALLVVLAAAAVTVVLDQLTKWWALEALTNPTRVIDLFWTLRLRVLFNTGTAFSLTTDSGPFVFVIGMFMIWYLLRFGKDQRDRRVLVALGLVLGGTVGNLADRVFRDGDGFLGGPVIDMVDLQWFPVWNLADAALVIGIGVLLLLGMTTDVLDEPDREPSS